MIKDNVRDSEYVNVLANTSSWCNLADVQYLH
jgi:hypothetical protein